MPMMGRLLVPAFGLVLVAAIASWVLYACSECEKRGGAFVDAPYGYACVERR